MLNIKSITMEIKTKLDDILNFTDEDKLIDFIKNYAQKDATFYNALLEAFSPTRQEDSKKTQPREDYASLIRSKAHV